MHGFEGMGFGMGWWWIIGLIFILAIIWMYLVPVGDDDHKHEQHLHGEHKQMLFQRVCLK